MKRGLHAGKKNQRQPCEEEQCAELHKAIPAGALHLGIRTLAGLGPAQVARRVESRNDRAKYQKPAENPQIQMKVSHDVPPAARIPHPRNEPISESCFRSQRKSRPGPNFSNSSEARGVDAMRAPCLPIGIAQAAVVVLVRQVEQVWQSRDSAAFPIESAAFPE